MESSGPGIAPAVELPLEPAFEPNEQYEEDVEGPRWRTPRLLWENRRLLLRVACYAFVISAIATLFISNEYTSTAQLMPPNSAPSTLDLIGGLTGLSSGQGMLSGGSGASGGLTKLLTGASDMGEIFAGIMQSETLEDRIIDRFGLMGRYHCNYIEDARKALENHVDIQIDRKTSIISIAVSDKDPRLASAMAQAYVQELKNVVSEVSNTTAHRERLFLDGRLQTIKARLDEDSRQFSQFSSKNSTLDLSAQTQAMVGAAASLQGEVIAAQAELEGLKQIYTSDNYRVKQTEAQIAELQGQLEKLGGKDVNTLKSTLGPGELYPSIRELPLLGVGWTDLLRQLKIDETVYELLTEQAELARIEEARESPSVEVIDPGIMPEKKSWPPRALLALLTAFLAAVAAGVFILFRQRWVEMDPQDELKLLLQEMYVKTRTHRVWQFPVMATIVRVVARLASKFAEFDRRIWRDVPFKSNQAVTP